MTATFGAPDALLIPYAYVSYDDDRDGHRQWLSTGSCAVCAPLLTVPKKSASGIVWRSLTAAYRHFSY